MSANAYKIDWYQCAIDKLGLIEVTKWYSIDNQKNVSFNHFEMGHVKSDKPVGFPEQNKVWEGMRWTKRYASAERYSQPLKLHVR